MADWTQETSAPPAFRSGPMRPGRDARTRALDLLARQFTRALTRFFSRRVSCQDEVPDLVQDVFLRVSSIDPCAIEKPEHYLFVTARNSLRDKARREKARLALEHIRLDETVVPGSEISPLRVLEGKAAVAQLRAALLELPERTRDIFVLRVFEEFRMAEVARTMGISTRAAERHYARALVHVVRALEDWRNG